MLAAGNSRVYGQGILTEPISRKISRLIRLATAVIVLPKHRSSSACTPSWCDLKAQDDATRYRQAADQGDRRCPVTTSGSCTPMARVSSKDDAEAVTLVQNGAEQGHANAQFNLGFMYADGRRAVLKDEAEVMRWYPPGRRTGSRHGAVQPRDHVRQRVRASSRTMPKPCAGIASPLNRVHANAQYSLGSMYASGRGVLKDDAEAVKWYPAGRRPG